MKHYDPACPVAGFILNRIGSHRHYEMTSEAVETVTGLPVLGWIPRCDDIVYPRGGILGLWQPGKTENPMHPVTL
jgi:cobyrinic acid a,c-diamide synthase